MSVSTLIQRPAFAGDRGPGLVAVDGRRFPLRSTAIAARAEGGLAESRLVQTYANPYVEPLEVIYTLPLPADGAVIGYTIKLGVRLITGEIERLEAAREAYERALEEGRTAGLLEQVRPDTFTQKLGSLPAGAEARIEIRVLHPLAFLAPAGREYASWEYRFPTVVGVRYQGEPGRVPDAGDLDVNRAAGEGTPVRLDLELVLSDGGPGELQPQSPGHALRIEASENGCLLRLKEAAPLDRDVVVQWRATTADVGVRLVEGAGLPGDDGRYGLLTITPPERPGATFARDLTILIDASGSMSGDPLESCKEVVRALLGSLGPGDRFEMLAFSDSVRNLVRGPVNATPARIRRAQELLRNLEARGGTEMAHAMFEALSPLRPDAQRQVILLTDGHIGFESQVIAVVRAHPPGCRVHAVGVGSAPNRTLTRGVARAGRGAEIFIDSFASASSAAQRLLAATVGPVLTDVWIEGTACRRVAPERLRDILAGQPLVAALELAPQGGVLQVRGRLAGCAEAWVQMIEVTAACSPAAAAGPLPIGALFGRESVEDLELRLATAEGGDAASIEAEIEAIGLRHRITTRRTSLVAICDEPTVDPAAPRRRERLAVELPAGVSAEGVGLRPMMHAGAPAYASLECSLSLGAPLPRRKSADMYLGAARGRRVYGGAMDEEAVAGFIRARITRRDGDLLVIEFESPSVGFTLPQVSQKVGIRSTDGDAFEAKVDGSTSTRPGPHDAGLTLRLGLRRSDGRPWPRTELWLHWSAPDGTPVIVMAGESAQP